MSAPNSGTNDPNSSTINTGDLRQILAISTSLTDENSRNDVRPVDEERREFFFKSVQSIREMQGAYQDDIEIIKKCLEQLRTYPTDEENCSVALQNIMELVDHIDVASDFMKLGGFPVVGQFLSHNNSELVRFAAEIIGISCQNHPTCQNAIVQDSKIFDKFVSILKSPHYNDKVKMKAVFAISCLIQNNKEGHDKFVKMNGYDALFNVLKTAEMALRLRICFVLDCLCSQFPQIKSMLLEKQLIGYFVDILTKIPIDESKETVVNAMLTFVEGFYDAIKECRKKEHNLAATLDYIISHYPPEFAEEKQNVIRLKNELNRFSSSDKN